MFVKKIRFRYSYPYGLKHRPIVCLIYSLKYLIYIPIDWSIHNHVSCFKAIRILTTIILAKHLLFKLFIENAQRFNFWLIILRALFFRNIKNFIRYLFDNGTKKNFKKTLTHCGLCATCTYTSKFVDIPNILLLCMYMCVCVCVIYVCEPRIRV